MARKNKLKAVVSRQIERSPAFNALERFVLNLDRDRSAETPHVNLKYYTSSVDCFSSWTPANLKAFSRFINKIRAMTWDDIRNSGGGIGSKAGLGYTVVPRRHYPANAALDAVSEDITFFELRIDEKVRVHGFRCMDGFYLVYLDRSHQLLSRG